MKKVTVTRAEDGRRITEAKMAHSPWSRFWGLMGRRALPEGEALVIDPCSSIHTMFMRFAIDVVFLDKHNRVVKIAVAMPPFRAALARGCRRVIEMPAGSAERAGVQVGDTLTIELT